MWTGPKPHRRSEKLSSSSEGPGARKWRKTPAVKETQRQEQLVVVVVVMLVIVLVVATVSV
eukprot:7464500-Pyramimonas_sp.AAC.1